MAQYHKAIRAQKKHHWKSFLAEHMNIWKAVKYLHPDDSQSSTKIAYLQKDQDRLTESQEIGEVLLENFFPLQSPANRREEQNIPPRQTAMEPITNEEVKNAIFRAHPNKALGPCSLSTLV